MTSRTRAVSEGRALVRVRDERTGHLATAAVCPGCWNSRRIRPLLLAQLAGEGLAVVHDSDGQAGIYRRSRRHAPRCPRGIAKKKGI